MSIVKNATKLRFHIQDDLILLREVLGCNPFENYNQWTNIHTNVTRSTAKNFSVRTVREHTDHLIKLFKKNDRVNLRKSGTEEQYDEKEQLLQQIVDLEREYTSSSNSSKRQKTSKSCSSSANRATIERDLAASSHYSDKHVISDSEDDEDYLVETETEGYRTNTNERNAYGTQNIESQLEGNNGQDDDATQVALLEPPAEPIAAQNVLRTNTRTTKNTRMKNNALQYLKDRKEAELEVRQRELQLEERKVSIEERKIALEQQKINLEEAKFNIEKEERAQRLQLEIEERSHKVLLEKQQAEINSILVKQLINK